MKAENEMKDSSTDLVISVASEASESALSFAHGSVHVRVEG